MLICDGCGEPAIKKPVAVFQYTMMMDNMMTGGRKYDLCEGCRKTVVETIDSAVDKAMLMLAPVARREG